MGYETKNLIKNMGPLFFYAICLSIFIILFLIARFLLLKFERGKRFYNFVSKFLFFNFILRFLIEAYLEFTLSSFLNLKQTPSKESGEYVSFVFAIVGSFLSILLPIFILAVVTR